jgi:hypothetical protein
MTPARDPKQQKICMYMCVYIYIYIYIYKSPLWAPLENAKKSSQNEDPETNPQPDPAHPPARSNAMPMEGNRCTPAQSQARALELLRPCWSQSFSILFNPFQSFLILFNPFLILYPPILFYHF